MQPCVYMMASKRHGTIYIGATSDLSAREWEHVSRAKPKSFTARYNVRRLVWFEDHETMALRAATRAVPQAVAKAMEN